MKKEYKIPPPEKDKVGEPPLFYQRSNDSSYHSYSQSLINRKEQFIQIIRSLDEDTFYELESIFKTLVEKSTPFPPCSVEELIDRIDLAVKEVEEGVYFTHEEVKNRYKKGV